ncbi:hypothetical protein IEQ34_017804 [Dendrobium chrysotoxum]|uniref:Uncharacterized protein n=1 Tax=Dendrobium chrysotoxum TaxID=161865 RepID=A0AAV7FUS5_DENCH|nr:hypothetical protein IEQ34_017804 [Dendrobium chrysotoxum]
MFARVSSLSEPLNGVAPYNNSKIRTPSVHQSTELPCPSPDTISGARYSCVPTNDIERRSMGSATKTSPPAGPPRRLVFLTRLRFGWKQDTPGTMQLGRMQLVLAAVEAVVAARSFGWGLEEGRVGWWLRMSCAAGEQPKSALSDRSKSVSMMWPSDLTRTFSGFRSRISFSVLARALLFLPISSFLSITFAATTTPPLPLTSAKYTLPMSPLPSRWMKRRSEIAIEPSGLAILRIASRQGSAPEAIGDGFRDSQVEEDEEDEPEVVETEETV